MQQVSAGYGRGNRGARVARLAIVALIILAIVALILARVMPSSQHAHAESGKSRAPACTMISAVVGSFDASPRTYTRVCVTFIPRAPAFYVGNNCDYMLEDIPGVHIALQCVYAGADGGHWAYTATGARVWEYVTCTYYADDIGVINACSIVSPLSTDD